MARAQGIEAEVRAFLTSSWVALGQHLVSQFAVGLSLRICIPWPSSQCLSLRSRFSTRAMKTGIREDFKKKLPTLVGFLRFL